VQTSGPENRRRGRAAFTLIELSIVLVIIGLVVGGVLVGRDLIKAAEARSVISDIDKYKTAAMAFYGKYDCLPGDCPNASTFFGASANCGLGPLAPGTCNGNGNGQIENYYAAYTYPGTGATQPAGATPSYTYHSSEDVLFWQQLSLAGMIEGSYSGFNGSSGIAYVVADNPVPFSSRISGACYGVSYSTEYYSTGIFYPNFSATNEFFLGNPTGSQGCGIGVITPIQAQSIDSKIDDGKPDTGSVTTWEYSTPTGCVSTPGSPPYAYVTTNITPSCALIFRAGF